MEKAPKLEANRNQWEGGGEGSNEDGKGAEGDTDEVKAGASLQGGGRLQQAEKEQKALETETKSKPWPHVSAGC